MVLLFQTHSSHIFSLYKLFITCTLVFIAYFIVLYLFFCPFGHYWTTTKISVFTFLCYANIFIYLDALCIQYMYMHYFTNFNQSIISRERLHLLLEIHKCIFGSNQKGCFPNNFYEL